MRIRPSKRPARALRRLRGMPTRHASTDQHTDEALARLGTPVPDSALALRARERITDVATATLANHSVGLLAAYDLGGCYEVDGAIAAERLVRLGGQPEARARAVHDVIALHNDDDLPTGSASEVVLPWDAADTDVTGHRLADVGPAIIPGLLAAYPRLDFKREFTALLVDQVSRKPACPAAAMIAAGILEEIAQAPFES